MNIWLLQTACAVWCLLVVKVPFHFVSISFLDALSSCRFFLMPHKLCLQTVECDPRGWISRGIQKVIKHGVLKNHPYIYTDVQLPWLKTGGYLTIFDIYHIFICYVSGWFNLGLSLCLFLGYHLCISLFEENSWLNQPVFSRIQGWPFFIVMGMLWVI